jgi:hypothetical protein
MGHIRLNRLPRTYKWRQVVDLIGSGAPTPPVAAATLDAAKQGLANASKDPALIYSLFLLTQIPQCARQQDFGGALRSLGLNVSDEASLPEIIGAFTEAVDAHVYKVGGRTDLGEMAQMTAAETLARFVDVKSENLFGVTPDIVQQSFGQLATKRQFSILARTFFARLTERVLGYFLSRELAGHVGAGQRFQDIHAKQEFERALQHHCWQAALIVEEYSGGWYSKQNYFGGISESKARQFAGYAMKKLRDELQEGAEVA